MSDGEGRRYGFEWALMHAFGVRLDAEEAGNCVTPAHTIAMIESKVESGGPEHRLLPVAWKRMRRALASVLDRGTAEITPDLDLDEALPRRGRPALWRRLGNELEATLPRAERPDEVPLIIVFATLAGGCVLYVLSIAEHLFYEWYYLITPGVIAAGAVGAGVLAFLLTRFVRVSLPYETADDAARGLLTYAGDHAALNGGIRGGRTSRSRRSSRSSCAGTGTSTRLPRTCRCPTRAGPVRNRLIAARLPLRDVGTLDELAIELFTI